MRDSKGHNEEPRYFPSIGTREAEPHATFEKLTRTFVCTLQLYNNIIICQPEICCRQGNLQKPRCTDVHTVHIEEKLLFRF